MAEADDQENPESTGPRKPECKAGGQGGSCGQYVTQLLQTICDARRNRSGNETYDRAQPQQQSNLLR